MKNFRKGFTLLEILLVVGIIAILAGITIVAINPSKQLAQVRNTERKSDIKTIYNAINQYYIDNSHYPASLTSVLTEVCDTDTATSSHSIDCTGMVDLSELVPKYLVAIPKDPKGPVTAFLNKIINTVYAATGGTGYYVMKDPANKVILNTERAELGVVVAIGTTTAMVDEEEIVVTSTLYWKNVGNDNSWNNPNNWFVDYAATIPYNGVPWVVDDETKSMNLRRSSDSEFVLDNIFIDVNIGGGEITGDCNFGADEYGSGIVFIRSDIYGGNFSGYFLNNEGNINGGNFTGNSFYNYGSGIIYGGTFTGSYFGSDTGTKIYGGTFTGPNFYNGGDLYDGIISGNNSSNGGNIHGGTFSGDNFSNYSYGTINNGTFSGTGLTNSGIINSGTFSGDDLLNYGTINDGTFSGSRFQNHNEIYGGVFNGDGFINQSTISNGIFSGPNFNNYGGAINRGTFSGSGFTNSGGVWGGTFSGNSFTNNDADFSFQETELIADGITITINSSCTNYNNPAYGISPINGGTIIYPE